MRFVKRPIVENLLVDGAGRNEHKPRDPVVTRRFDQPQRADYIPLGKVDEIPFAPSKRAARMIESSMNDCITAFDQFGRRGVVSQITFDPGQAFTQMLEA